MCDPALQMVLLVDAHELPAQQLSLDLALGPRKRHIVREQLHAGYGLVLPALELTGANSAAARLAAARDLASGEWFPCVPSSGHRLLSHIGAPQQRSGYCLARSDRDAQQHADSRLNNPARLRVHLHQACASSMCAFACMLCRGPCGSAAGPGGGQPGSPCQQKWAANGGGARHELYPVASGRRGLRSGLGGGKPWPCGIPTLPRHFTWA